MKKTVHDMALTKSQLDFYAEVAEFADDPPEVSIMLIHGHVRTTVKGIARIRVTRPCSCGSSKHVETTHAVHVGAEWKDGKLYRSWPVFGRSHGGSQTSQSLAGALRSARHELETRKKIQERRDQPAS